VSVRVNRESTCDWDLGVDANVQEWDDVRELVRSKLGRVSNW
jgi:hypothetical protein